MNAIDELKITSVFYRAIIAGRLNFLLVQNGYKYQLHDVIRLAEVNDKGEHTGHIAYVQIMFVIADPVHGLRDGYAALSVRLKIQSSRHKPGDLVLEPTPKKPKE